MKDKQRIYDRKFKDKLTQNAIESMRQKTMLDEHIWTSWFKKKPSFRNCDLTAMEAFDLMIKDCYYCGNIALSIDRLDSDKEHTLDNCVGCCTKCNESKGAVDPKTFVLQAVYRSTFEYPEDDDIWYEQKTKPKLSSYKRNIENQKKQFELTKDQFNKFIIDECVYCKRTPTTFFGIDKIDPSGDYTINNCVTSCASCNWSKWNQSVEEFKSRDALITERYMSGCFDNMKLVEKNTSYRRLITGKSRVSGAEHPDSKKVYRYDLEGNFIDDFGSLQEAAKRVNGNHSGIAMCARGKRNTAYKFKWSYEPPENDK
ncbi:hypothetical protein PBCVNY2B_824R [Paramecium bursaria Chlorella virus NY2B]|uniref:Uncharacterized protein B798R n=1 Tax=Paramecium bursaria Chlorella virus NY2A TaxID=46021 RepID=A7IXX3_PBCVN|nr:hypothetical protein NY2A_B798R [Paramecium bursaria Chlorella virus NY2A]ABT15197.1 hypothetical protein NY2A_B798R [Paramecium bursaria Chlorella virus NY2A]AGE58519.1 hypothetical protein PBCVNY2B_824R [Paramecium bursaria Chlorella virus NY2B]